MKLASTCLLVATALATDLVAQSWTFPMDPRASYLRTNNDLPSPPLVLDLGNLGVAPGQWLHLGTIGAYRSINGGPDTYRSLVGVFANGATLLTTDVQQRVVGAIAAGPAVASGPTFFGQLPIDIAEDFDCSRLGWDTGIDVVVPAGATHLFLGTHESLYRDNVDPNGDFAVVVTVATSPTLPGTGEHIALRTSVNGTPSAWPDVRLAAPASTMTAELRYPLGLVDGSIYAFVADIVATNAPAPNPLPGLWSANLFVLQTGVLPGTPGFTDTWSMVTPSGYAGLSLIVQGATLTPSARNGLFETTAAHRFALQ